MSDSFPIRYPSAYSGTSQTHNYVSFLTRLGESEEYVQYVDTQQPVRIEQGDVSWWIAVCGWYRSRQHSSGILLMGKLLLYYATIYRSATSFHYLSSWSEYTVKMPIFALLFTQTCILHENWSVLYTSDHSPIELSWDTQSQDQHVYNSDKKGKKRRGKLDRKK